MSFQSLAFALPVTIIVEFAVYCVMLQKKPKTLLLASILVNAFTLPLALIAFTILQNFLLIEAVVFVVEIPLLKALLLETSFKKTVLLSLFANTASALVGLFWA